MKSNSTFAVAAAAAGSILFAPHLATTGQWSRISIGGHPNTWDFDVFGNTACFTGYQNPVNVITGQSQAEYDGSASCVPGGSWNFEDLTTSTFPHGHAERVAADNQNGYPSPCQGWVATAEGFLWCVPPGTNPVFKKVAALPAALPTGVNTNGVMKLVIEAISSAFYPNPRPTNPIWLLGSDGHVYHFIASASDSAGVPTAGAWTDAGLTNVTSLSYSKAILQMVATESNGKSFHWDSSSNQWFSLYSSSHLSSVTGFAPVTGGLYESLCNSTLNNKCFSKFFINWWFPFATNYPSNQTSSAWGYFYGGMGNGVPQPAGKGVDAWWNEALDVNGIDSGFWYAYRNPVDLTEPAILFMEEGSALSFYTGETSWASNLLSTYDNISNGTDVLWVLNEFLQAYVYSESSSFQTTFDGPYSNP